MTRLIVDDEGKGCALEACPWLAHYPMRHSMPGTRQFAKRTVDIALAAFVLFLALPFLAAAAIAIKLTSPGGPVVFRQRRTGYQGRQFTLFKLRTMVPNA